MSNFNIFKASVSAAALLTAGAAQADVTASQVWTEFQEMMGLYGENSLSFSGGEEIGGDVTVEDIVMTMTADDELDVVAEVGTMVFDGQDNGSVIITMDDSYPIVLNGEEGETIAMTITQSGMRIVATGDPGEISYAVTADRYGVIVDEIQDPAGSPVGDIRFVGNDLSGNYTVKTGEMRDVDYALAMSSLDVLLDITDPTNDGAFLFSGKMNELAASAALTLPLEFDPEQPELMFTAGLTGGGNYTFTSADYIFDFNEDGQAVQGSISTGAGFVDGGMNGDNLAYDTSLTDLNVNLSVPDFPFPINVSMAKYGFGLAMPIAATEEPADLGLKVNLTDLAVNDEIWMMGDPTNVLPHDPITLNLDIVGQAKLLFDLFDPEQSEALVMSETPAELNSLTLKDLTLRAVGAEVTGTGEFTFDNTDLETFDGMPRPTGSVTVNVNGANKLIDSLVSMGILPQEQASMGRMMMGMFARTVGDDQLTSTLEINDEGHVLANGQRIQ